MVWKVYLFVIILLIFALIFYKNYRLDLFWSKDVKKVTYKMWKNYLLILIFLISFTYIIYFIIYKFFSTSIYSIYKYRYRIEIGIIRNTFKEQWIQLFRPKSLKTLWKLFLGVMFLSYIFFFKSILMSVVLIFLLFFSSFWLT